MITIRQYVQNHRYLFWICGIGLIVRLIMGIVLPTGFDEAYYAQYAGHPAWGYFDHPPAVAVTAGIGFWLTGIRNPLTLRLGAILLFLGSSFLLYESTRILFNRKAAVYALLLFHFTPYFVFGVGLFVFPDNALTFFWLLALYSLIRLKQSDNPRWFLVWGAACGLSMLAKYHGILLFGATGILLIFYRDWRHYLVTPYLYIGFIIAALLFMPNLVWNSRHDWITLITQFGKSTSGGINLSLTLFLQGIIVQAGYLLPWIMVILLWVSLDFIRKNTLETRWLIPFIGLPVVIFTLIGATRTILPHWPMPGYLGAVILTGGWLLQRHQKFNSLFMWLSGFITVLAAILFIFQTYTGFFPLQKKNDPTLDGYGWNQVIRKLEERQILTKPGPFILAHKWFTGGQLAFAAGHKYPVTVFNKTAPHGFAFWGKNQSFTGRDAIFITSERFPDDPRQLFGNFFTSVAFIDTVQVKRCGKLAQSFLIWQCRQYNGSYQPPYGER